MEAVQQLGMKELKDELRECGQAMMGNKGELADHLKKAIEQNVPVVAADAAPHHECMNGLDVMASVCLWHRILCQFQSLKM